MNVNVLNHRGRDRMVVVINNYYGSCINNYLWSQCLSPLKLWVRRIPLNVTLCDKVCQWLATGLWFSPGPPVSSTNITDPQDIAEILLKVALNTITIVPNPLTHLYSKHFDKYSWFCDISYDLFPFCLTYDHDHECVKGHYQEINDIFLPFLSNTN
jgi:hypothetical protein